MNRFHSASLMALALVAGSAFAGPPRIAVASALVKVRPTDALPTAQTAEISAARNEFEAFQIVVHGGDLGAPGVTATASDLVGPNQARIPSSEIVLYREGLYNAVKASSTDGATGFWPDPLIPAVDAYFKETRNAFPFDVPAGESRAVWVEVFVPLGTLAGVYQGTVTVNMTNGPSMDVPVRLQVRGFDLPSTATLKSAFGITWSLCVTHLGSYGACGDDGVDAYLAMYSRAALDHRVTISEAIYGGPSLTGPSRFETYFGPQLDGTASTRLVGARQTSAEFHEADTAKLQRWHDSFARKGRLDLLYHYTMDEPSSPRHFAEIPGKAAPARAAGVRTLVTTDIARINQYKLGDLIDIAVPLLNFMYERNGKYHRAEYDAFLALSPDKEVWMYQSCMSHGCGPTTDPYFTGWPSYVIDASGVQNRAMEWFSFQYDVTGELYFDSAGMLAKAWETQWSFDGNGDGNLFYPGTPDRIGGKSHIPIESIRLKLIREGMEDYEYLRMLCDLGDCDWAKSTARTLFPKPFEVTSVSPEALYATRAALADRIESKLAATPLPAIYAGGVVNAASYTAPLSGGAVAAIFGQNLALETLASSAETLPTSLGGVTVRLNGILAPLYFISPTQINAQVPWEIAGATVLSVTVVAPGGLAGAPLTASPAPHSPALFSMNFSGAGQGVIIIAATGEAAAATGSVPGFPSRPARRNQEEEITIYCLGLGEVTDRPATRAAASAAPLSAATALPVVTIGGLPAKVTWAGLAPGFVGVYQLNVQVNRDTPTGGAVPVTVSVGGLVSNSVTIAVGEN